MRRQRLQRTAIELNQQAVEGVPEVSAEFLAALPPNIQEEVSSGLSIVIQHKKVVCR